MKNSLPNNWQVKTLGEVAFITSGQNAPQGSANFSSKGIPFIRAGSLEKLTNGFKDVDLEKIDNENANKLRFKVFPSGCVLFAKSGMSAAKDRVIELKFPAYIVTHLAIAKPNEQLHSSYLAYFLRKYRPSRLIKDFGYPSISLEDVARIQIPLPPLPIQKQIAEILEKADQARQKRKEANKLTDEFLQSVFIEMFGDPVKNPKGWEVKKIKDVVSIQLQNGAYFTEDKYTNDLNGVEMVHMSDAFYETVKSGGLKKVIVTESEKLKYELKNYDILIARRSLNFEGAAKACLVVIDKNPMIYESSFIRIRVNEKIILPIYLFLFLSNERARKAYVSKYITSSTISGINHTNLSEVGVLIPPILLQHNFAEIVNKTEVLKEKQKQSEQELENLFQSLMQKAFKGELVA